MHVRWVVALWAALLIPSGAAQAQNELQPQSSSSANSGRQKYSHANDFLIRGTVFAENARAFPDVWLRIRRAGEKKFHWEDRTNSRGEFAIRVPPGTQYEIVVHVKGFANLTRTIDARNGSGENNVVFRMEPTRKGKQ
jgi:hypothetical protein